MTCKPFITSAARAPVLPEVEATNTCRIPKSRARSRASSRVRLVFCGPALPKYTHLASISDTVVLLGMGCGSGANAASCSTEDATLGSRVGRLDLVQEPAH